MPFLQGASGVIVHGNLVEVSYNNTASGLDILLKSSYPDAAHDSAARDPPKCFPGTRLQHIEDIIGWAEALAVERCFRMMWLHGPAGVGKSALAQTCAERLSSSNKLAAAFFFSRPNDLQDPTRFFISIAYQLTTRYPSYRDKLDEKIRHDPTLVQKTIAVQFQELIVVPLRELQEEGQTIGGGIVLIDGLDECAGEDAQCAIIDITSTSVRDQSTPFIWAFFSRPEPRIVAQFSAPHVDDLCWRLTLPISRDADSEIELYIRDAFRRIRIQFDIPSAALWPSEENLQDLVDRSAGLFIYPASVIRFVGEGGPLGPEEQLRLVLRLPSKLSGNPWSHLDAFYTLIVDRTPKIMLPNALKLLAVHTCITLVSPAVAAAVLGFSLSTFTAALSKLHSVVRLKHSDDGLPTSVSFYHASFMDFLGDPARSGEFCAKTPELYATLLADVIGLSKSGFKHVIPPWKIENFHFPEAIFYLFWSLGSYANLDRNLLEELAEFDFQELDTAGPFWQHRSLTISSVQGFYKNVPPTWRGKILRPLDLQQRGSLKFPLILGNDRKKAVLFLLSYVKPPVCCLDFRNYAIIKLQRRYIELLESQAVPPSQDSVGKILDRADVLQFLRSESEPQEPEWSGGRRSQSLDTLEGTEAEQALEKSLKEWLQEQLLGLQEEQLEEQIELLLERLFQLEARLRERPEGMQEERVEEEHEGLVGDSLTGLLRRPGPPMKKAPLYRQIFLKIKSVVVKLVPC